MNNELSFDDLEIPEPDRSVFYSHDVLKKKLAEGSFDRLRDQLHSFVKRHTDEILEIAADVDHEFPGIDRRDNLLATIRAMVEASQGVSPAAEMGDQIKEINKEIWYRGEEGKTDRKQISQEWVQKHSSHWRNARLQELLYLIDNEPAPLIDLVEKSDKA